MALAWGKRVQLKNKGFRGLVYIQRFATNTIGDHEEITTQLYKSGLWVGGIRHLAIEKVYVNET